MRIFLCLIPLAFAACASNPQHARYAQEKNAPKFGNSKSFLEKPDEVLRAARVVLDKLSRESDPPVVSSVKGNDEMVRSGWVYDTSKTKYLEFIQNQIPTRRPLRVRRKYTYTVTPSLSGSQVTFGAEEEVMKLDLTTGEDKDWASEATDPAVWEMMTQRLQEELRRLKS